MTVEPLPIAHSAFDELAAAYDQSFTTTKLGRWLRSAVWQRFDASFTGRRKLLDIGCGTGEDAIRLAALGHEVVATDVSHAMLAVARAKAARSGCAERVDFRCVPMEKLGEALNGERFDGAYSNFGAINCTTATQETLRGVGGLLRHDSPLILVVMGRYVLWEWAWFLARGQARNAFRRLRYGGTAWRGLNIVYPTPAALARALPGDLLPERCHALGLLLPPSYAARWLDNSPRAFRILARTETAVSAWQVLAAFGDHYVWEARRA